MAEAIPTEKLAKMADGMRSIAGSVSTYRNTLVENGFSSDAAEQMAMQMHQLLMAKAVSTPPSGGAGAAFMQGLMDQLGKKPNR